jgi:hypothetical protein
MVDKAYEEGLRDGKIKALEAGADRQMQMIEAHDKRITCLEKIAWVAAGVTLAVQLGPQIANFIEMLAQ